MSVLTVEWEGISQRGKWKPYQEYKASDVLWMGEIPLQWEVKRLKDALSRNDSGVWGDEGEIAKDVVVLRSTDMSVDGKWNIINPEYRKLNENEYRNALLFEGDLLITKSSGSALHLGKTAIVTHEIERVGCCFSNFMQRLRANYNYHPKYLYWILNIPLGREQLNYFGSTTTGLVNLNGKVIADIFIPSPTLDEQAIIVQFIDRETAKIESTITKKERLIALLEEKRTALINHAITKGLNTATSLKDSGVEWIGEIPSHWNCAPLYSRYKVQLGKMLDSLKIKGTVLAPYIRNVDVQWDRINTDNLPYMDFDETEKNRFRLDKGDLIVCEGGEVGRAALWIDESMECYYQKALHRLRPFSNGENPRFMFYSLFAASKRGVFIAEGNPNTIDHLTAEKLRRHRFAFPARDEQDRIVEFLDKMTTKIENLENKVRQQIAKLSEHRISLITAAVTGKIDVRGYINGDLPDYE